ncbi:MAG: medium chain dehydrogenase/reductase family protein [Ilumatobacteraceae bacterium]|nr:zinc-binding dehydrogenase [Acidimicrobiales bacterium]MCB9395255.1 zinc-binding dehydrogenase [Acidimicrobiaceae bacterium]
MKALQVDKKVAKLGMARVMSTLSPTAAAKYGPLDLVTIDPPALPGAGWRRVHTHLAGICGSDLATVEGQASPYFDDWVSFPFVPGHEVVGHLDDGRRVVIEPVLGHAARGFAPPFDGAAPGDGDDYAHLARGSLEPGIQIGFCNSTCGGWAPQFVAHESQIHEIPDTMTDEQAVLVEPAAGGIHAALLTLPVLAGIDRPVVAVLGAGTMGLCAIAGLRRHVPGVQIVVGARYPHQQAFATALGADVVAKPDELARAVRRLTGSQMIGDHLSGGADATIDAVGTSESIADCLRFTRPRGRVVLMGMPAQVSVDLTGLWHRETQLVGAYTYGTETMPDGSRRRTFDLAIETAQQPGFERLLSATYRIDDYTDALAHAAAAGRRGAVKIAFDLRPPVKPVAPASDADDSTKVSQ